MKSVCIVGSASSIKGTKLGSLIDSYDIVVRINDPVIKGFEEDVGSKTNHLYLPPCLIAGRYNQQHGVVPRTRYTSHPLGNVLDSLNAAPGEKVILLSDAMNFDFSVFYSQMKHKILEEVRFGFIPISSVPKSERSKLGKGQNFREYWASLNFDKLPSNGTLIVEYYRHRYEKISIAGFGSKYTIAVKEQCHYWDENGISTCPSRKEVHGNFEDGIRWLQLLHDEGKVVNLELTDEILNGGSDT